MSTRRMRPSGRILMETGMVTTHLVSIQTDAHTPRDTQNTIERDVQTPMRTATQTPLRTGHRTMGLTHSLHTTPNGATPTPMAMATTPLLPTSRMIAHSHGGRAPRTRGGALTATGMDGRTMAMRLRAIRRSGAIPTPMATATTHLLPPCPIPAHRWQGTLQSVRWGAQMATAMGGPDEVDPHPDSNLMWSDSDGDGFSDQQAAPLRRLPRPMGQIRPRQIGVSGWGWGWMVRRGGLLSLRSQSTFCSRSVDIHRGWRHNLGCDWLYLYSRR